MSTSEPLEPVCYDTRQKGIKATDGIKVANQMTLKLEDYTGLSGGPHVLQGPLRVKESGGRGV